MHPSRGTIGSSPHEYAGGARGLAELVRVTTDGMDMDDPRRRRDSAQRGYVTGVVVGSNSSDQAAWGKRRMCFAPRESDARVQTRVSFGGAGAFADATVLVRRRS
jgi:hypothetical protein